MSFDFLPLPLFIVLVLGSAFYVLFIAWRSFQKDNKLLAISYLFLALADIGGGLYRLFRDLRILVDHLGVIIFLAISLLGVGVILNLVGTYKTVKNDEKKKIFFLKKLYFLLSTLIISGILVYFFFKSL